MRLGEGVTSSPQKSMILIQRGVCSGQTFISILSTTAAPGEGEEAADKECGRAFVHLTPQLGVTPHLGSLGAAGPEA